MATPLQNLYNKVPGLDSTAEKQARAATNIQLKQQASQVAGQAPGLSGARAAQAIAPAAVQAQAQAGQQAQAQQQQLTGQQAQLALGQEQLGAQARTQRAATEQQSMLAQKEREQFERLAQAQQDTKRKITQEDIKAEKNLAQRGLILDNDMFFVSDKQYKDLANIDRGLAQKLFDDRRVFRENELGRGFANEVQLADYAVTKAKNQQELASYQQAIEQEMKRSEVMFQSAIDDLKDTLRRGFLKEKGDLDRASQYRMERTLRQLEQKQADDAKDAAQKQAIMNTVITIGSAALIAFCMHEDTQIDTPEGTRVIRLLKPGQLVWSVNEKGQRVKARILRVNQTPTSDNHELVQIEFANGRVVRGSPNHPTADKRVFADLKPKDKLQDVEITKVSRISYANRKTYDILVDTATSFYFVDGILIGSTLK